MDIALLGAVLAACVLCLLEGGLCALPAGEKEGVTSRI